MFWDDYVPPTEKKEKPKREPPDPVWLRPDYLPWLDEARSYQINIMSDYDIVLAQQREETLIWDLEVYPNYFLGGFKSIETGKIALFEMDRYGLLDVDRSKFRWMLENFLLVGFNDEHFDLPIATVMLRGYTTDQLMDCVRDIIGGNQSAWEFYKAHKVPRLRIDHIDLIELTPLAPSLKVAAGRLHAPRMQDLPFAPYTNLTDEQIEVLRWYWCNDLDNTELLFKHRLPEIELRQVMSQQYRVDLRSKSDPQIAEAVVRSELQKLTGQRWFTKAKIEPGRTFRYKPPAYLRYQTPMMQDVLRFVCDQDFEIDEYGGPIMPEGLRQLKVNIGNSVYNLGIGGLHSQEKQVIYLADQNVELTDNDVTSYYPSLILQQQMYPPNIGPEFLQVFGRIYERRLSAKAAGDKTTADTLKIVLNGTFGKTGERGGRSIFYYPEMMIQVTVTGQLDLLMLIEALELSGIEVVSANTDGVMIKCHRSMLARRDEILKWWEDTTELQLESTKYKAVYARDVNNYIAFYEKPKGDSLAKTKGAYAFSAESGLKKNPQCEVCTEAVIQYLANGTPIEKTVSDCTDFKKFIEVRLVRGGACKDGEYLGRAIRWYYSEGEEGEIINAKNGHSIPRSHGARPCMRLPDAIPSDLNYTYYVTRAYGILDELRPAIAEPAIAPATAIAEAA
jgi:hypothetical protein